MRFHLSMLLLLVSACDDGGGGDTDSGPDPERDSGTPRADGGPPPPDCVSGEIPDLTATPIPGSPFASPIFVTQAPGRPDALWVVQQGGIIRIVVGETVTDFLDIRDRVTASYEQGLLGLAFHPDYEDNGRFFVFYTDNEWTNVVAEYRRGKDPNTAEDAEIARLVSQEDDEDNHNGGMIAFGPDGYLYVGMGDGGGGGDGHGEFGNGLNTQTLFGKILRLDVDNAGGGYAAPGNPFSGGEGLPQIWAYGVRNPWRFSFDRATGDFWLGDVGQERFEEIDYRAADDAPGANFGWRGYEGTSVYDQDQIDEGRVGDHVPPVFVVDRRNDPFLSGSGAIVGGYVYRGAAIPALRGAYLFGDNLSYQVGAFHYCSENGQVSDERTVTGLSGLSTNLGSFGEDLAGELYLVYVGGGHVMRIEAN